MKRFVIQRDIPNIGEASHQDLRAAATKSNEVLAEMGSGIQWVHSYVVADRTFCVYLAEDESLIHEHAAKSGFPATRVFEVKRIIDPATAAAAARLRV